MKIQTEVVISAAHIVHTTDSPCSRLHGHNWRIVVGIQGVISKDGMVADFIDIKKIINQLDHKFLLPEDIDTVVKNEEGTHYLIKIKDKMYSIPTEDCVLLPIPVVTAEHLAKMIANSLKVDFSKTSVEVTVYESEKSFATETLG